MGRTLVDPPTNQSMMGPNGWLKLRGGYGAEPSTANMIVRVSPPHTGGEAPSA